MRSYQLHPKSRYVIMTDMMDLLYKPTRKYMHEKISQIILDNSKAYKNNYRFLSYRGRYYSIDKFRRAPGPANILHRSLRPRMKEFEEQQRLIEEEEGLTSTYIVSTLQIAPFPGALRQMLPEALHPVITKRHNHLASGVCPVGQEEISAFMQRGEEYLLLIKRRLTMNLIDAS